ADAVEVVPPVRPGIPTPPVGIAGFAPELVSGVEPLDLAVCCLIGSAEHHALYFDGNFLAAVVGERERAADIDLVEAVAAPLYGCCDAIQLFFAQMHRDIDGGSDF